MLLESLTRLVLINEECKEQKIIINSEDFMKDTDSVIAQQVEVLQKDLKFQINNPGPYSFGLGKRSLNVFPPQFTESSDWALIIFNEETQIKEEIFIFQTTYGLIEKLTAAFKYIEDANTREQNTESKSETRSVQADTSTNIEP